MTNAMQMQQNDTAQPAHSRIVVSADHPTLGALYWSFADGSDHNAESCYSITDKPSEALVLQAGWRDGSAAWHYLPHMSKVLGDDEQFEQDYDIDETEDGSWAQVTVLGGPLKTLQQRSGQDVEVFADWLTGAVWNDVVVADTIVHLNANQAAPADCLHC